MADDVREYIRAAQSAEIRGDTEGAIANLVKAAALYRTSGNIPRALQMLRHARRLDGTRQDVVDELNRLEWIPERPLKQAFSPEEAEEEAKRALAPLDEVEPVTARQLIERGPTRADPSLAAWCSFCCRPTNEVGPLVAGPAGAFICRTCVEESRRLLGAANGEEETPKNVPLPPDVQRELDAWEQRPTDRMSLPPEGAVGPPPSSIGERPEPPPSEVKLEELPSPEIELVGQADAVATVEGAIQARLNLVLALGPEGSGKTTLLKHLARRHQGRYVTCAEELAHAGTGPVFFDCPRALSASDVERVLSFEGMLVLALRGQVPSPAIALKCQEAELPIVATRELVEATFGAIPLEVAERVQAVAVLRAMEADELVEIARRLVVLRAAELDLSDEVLSALAQEAARSGRGGNELKALLSRVPPGSWSLAAAPKPKRSRSRKKQSA